MLADHKFFHRCFAPLGAALALFLASCGDSSCTGPLCVDAETVSVSVSPTTGSLEVGETIQLTASVSGSSNTAVSWSISTGSSVVSVSTSGLVTGIGAGNAVVVATSSADGSKSASASITVTSPVAVSVSPTTDTIEAGHTTTLTATVTGATNTAVTWSVTSGATVADVTSGGVVTGLTAGTAVVQASAVADPTKTASATIVVEEPACDGGNITLNQTVAGTLATSDCQFGGYYEDDWFFTLGAQTDVVIDLGSFNFDAFVVLSEVDGDSLVFIEENDDASGTTTNAQLALTLDPGEYAISVTTFSQDETGSYTLSLTEGSPTLVDVVVENELLNEILIWVNGIAIGTVNGLDTATVAVSVIDLQVSWDLVPDTTSAGTEIGDLDIGGDYGTITADVLTSEETFTVDAVIGTQGIFKPLIINNTGVTLLMGVNVGLTSENLCNCTVPIGSAGTYIGYYYVYSNSNLYAYLSGSGYSGTPTFFTGFSGSVDPLSGYLDFTFSTPPSLVAPSPSSPAAIPSPTGGEEVGNGPSAFEVRAGGDTPFKPYRGAPAARSQVHHDGPRDPNRTLMMAPSATKPPAESRSWITGRRVR